MKQLSNSILAAALAMLSLAGATSAAESSGFYITGNVLYGTNRDLDVSLADKNGKITSYFNNAIENSTGGGLAVGYKFSLFRAEAEGSYMKSNVGKNNDNAAAPYKTDGSIQRWTFFINGYVEVPTLEWLYPYAGVGIGAAQLDLSVDGNNGIPADVFSYSDGETVFGWQAMAGLRFSINDMVSAHVGLRYRKISPVTISQLDPTDGSSTSARWSGGEKLFELGLSIGF